jgi:hypothetical protein
MITKTIMTLGIMASFVIGISFSSVYAGIPWGTDDIADDAITSDKIKNKQVKNADIRGNTIKSGKIRDGTITSADIAPGTLAVTQRSETRTMSPGSVAFFTVPCLSGEQPTGGGWHFKGPAKTKARIIDSNPSSNGWFVQSLLDNSASGNVDFTGYVECIRLQ